MSHRTFTDDTGTTWQVWEVHPTRVERRMGDRREGGSFDGPDRRKGPDRRVIEDHRIFLGPELAHGWLAFHSANEKRRYAPIPEGWASASTAELGRLCSAATPVASTRFSSDMQITTSQFWGADQRAAASADGRAQAERAKEERGASSAA